MWSVIQNLDYRIFFPETSQITLTGIFCLFFVVIFMYLPAIHMDWSHKRTLSFYTWGAVFSLTEYKSMLLHVRRILNILWHCFYLSLINFLSPSLYGYLLNLCLLTPHCLTPTFFPSVKERRGPKDILSNSSPLILHRNIFKSVSSPLTCNNSSI